MLTTPLSYSHMLTLYRLGDFAQVYRFRSLSLSPLRWSIVYLPWKIALIGGRPGRKLASDKGTVVAGATWSTISYFIINQSILGSCTIITYYASAISSLS